MNVEIEIDITPNSHSVVNDLVVGLPPGGVEDDFLGIDADGVRVWKKPPSGGGGTVGPPGSDGEDGASAYEIAVDNGFVGTEAEWLTSLNGAPGAPGAPGSDGEDGASADPLNEAIEFCDFYGAIVGSIWAGAGVGGGAAAAPIDTQLVGARGVVRIASSTTANSGYNYITSASHLAVVGNTSCRLRFQLMDTAGFANVKLRFGLNGNTTSADGTNEVSFIITGGAVVGVCRSAGAVTSTTTLGSITHSVWYGIKIDINAAATSVTFSLYSASGVLIASETLSSTIPVNTPVLRHGVIATHSGTTVYNLCLLDYMDLKHTALTRGF